MELLLRQVGDVIRTESDPKVRRALARTLRVSADRIAKVIVEDAVIAERDGRRLAPMVLLERQQSRAAAMREKRWLPKADPVLSDYVVIGPRFKEPFWPAHWGSPAGQSTPEDQPAGGSPTMTRAIQP